MFKMKLICIFKWIFTLTMLYNSVILVFMKKPFADTFSRSYGKQIRYLIETFNLRDIPYYLKPDIIDRNKEIIYDASIYSNFFFLLLGLFLSPCFYFFYGLKYFIFTTICANALPFDINDKAKLEMLAYSVGVFGVSCLLSGCSFYKHKSCQSTNGSANNL